MAVNVDRKISDLIGVVTLHNNLGMYTRDYEEQVMKIRQEIVEAARDKRGTYEEVHELIKDCWNVPSMLKKMVEAGYVHPKKEPVVPHFYDVQSACEWLDEHAPNNWFANVLQNPRQWKVWYVSDDESFRITEIEDELIDALNKLIESLVLTGEVDD